jgi:hypothetical protein
MLLVKNPNLRASIEEILECPEIKEAIYKSQHKEETKEEKQGK